MIWITKTLKSRATANIDFPIENYDSLQSGRNLKSSIRSKVEYFLRNIIDLEEIQFLEKVERSQNVLSHLETILSCDMVEPWNRQDAQKYYISLGLFIV